MQESLEDRVQRGVQAALQNSTSIPPLWQVSLQQVASAAAEKAVNDSWSRLGVNLHDATEWRSDLHYVRQLRQGSEYLRRRVLAGACSLLLASGLWMVWEGIRTVLPGR